MMATISIGHAAFSAVALFGAYIFYRLFIFPRYLSRLRHIRGPPSVSLITGNLTQFISGDVEDNHLGWIDTYGPVVRVHGLYGGDILYTVDPKLLAHVYLSHPYEYPKPDIIRGDLGRFLGAGVLLAEGDAHRRQRRTMNLPFTQASVNGYLPVFQAYADKLVEKLSQAIASEQAAKPSWHVMEMTSWISRTTLDIIGHVGFAYDTHALEGQESEITGLMNLIFEPRPASSAALVVANLVERFPLLTKIPMKRTKIMATGLAHMMSEGRKMLEQRQEWAEAGELDEKTDLMSLIFKANDKESSKKDKLRDDEVFGQISTFLLAGSDTSSATLTFILQHLSVDTAAQIRLREEVRTAKRDASAEGREHLSVEELLNLPYMDAILKETLRFDPPGPLSIRMASRDDTLPLGEGVYDRYGRPLTYIAIKKGTIIHVGITAFNRNKNIFGLDADTWQPTRWLDGSMQNEKLRAELKGLTLFSNMFTFLGGARSCVGYRFALLELKAILATLIDNFEFRERDPGGTPLRKHVALIAKPFVAGESDERGIQLPLRIRAAEKS